MKYEAFQAIAENYINGNISDFKKSLKRLSKKETMLLTVVLSEYFEPVNVNKAIATISKYLD
jgi:hypothetical protein